jgi:hypothetical protein
VRKVFARLGRVSPAMVVSMLALFVALTGTAVATTSALITGKQIKNGSITGLDIKNKSVTATDIKGRLRGATGARGPQGLAGPQGPQGPQGAQGIQGPAGQAVAFARVMSDGTLMPTDPPGNPVFAGQHKNVAQDNITHEADTGVYCFNVAFRPRSAMVAGDNLNASLADDNNWIVSVALDRGAGLDLCPGADARVVTTHVGDPPTNEDHGFVIWFE